ncbi:bublin coiled-coil protein [Rhynchophorus ferrugineus]|uniref:bublin coiled-coil protein n=1 Tax=Rhynchophorus ferrugineus TaxID=354439 RepID=UPI003FCC88A1
MGEQESFQKDPPKSDKNAADLANVEEQVPNMDGTEDNEDSISEEDLQNLDHQLDQLFVALDEIESKNDNLHAQLLQLLHSNREIRKELQNAQKVDDDSVMDVESS